MFAIESRFSHMVQRPIKNPLLSFWQQLLFFFLHPSTYYYQLTSFHQSITLHLPIVQQHFQRTTNAADIHHVFQHGQVWQLSHPVLSGKCILILVLFLVSMEKRSILKVLAQAQGGKNMSSGGFASRAQSAADRNAQGSSSNSNANVRSGNGQQSKSGQK